MLKILFITDIHQNIDALSKIDFTLFDLVLCGGDLAEPTHIKYSIIKDIVSILKDNNAFIIPGNCDKDPRVVELINNLNNIDKKIIDFNEEKIMGIGYSRSLRDDAKMYREYFLEDKKRIFEFYEKSPAKFILDLCGIKITGKDEFTTIPIEDTLKKSCDFIEKFASFSEDELDKYFDSIPESNFKNGIILSHSPSNMVLDKLVGLPNAGGKALKRAIDKYKPKLVLSGHFHELTGRVESNGTIFFNPGAIKDNKYGIITIDKDKIETEFKLIKN